VAHAAEDLPDGEHRKVYHLAVRSESAAAHDLRTELVIEPSR